MATWLTPWRWAAALLLMLFVAAPLALPLLELARQGLATWTVDDTFRVGHLFLQTALLVAGALELALPAGVCLALALFRTEFPGRRALLVLTILMLFVPLPMITSAWQAFFGSDGWLNLALWGANAGRPWTTGLGPAIWVHALAGLPWVILFVGIGLLWVERELEEDGLLLGPPWWVLWHITLPRCRGAIGFAAIWLALQTAGEIGVTDMMLVSTFAEEVQTQFTMGDRAAVARAVAAALPLALATWGWLAWSAPRLERIVPPLQMFLTSPPPFRWNRWRWPVAATLVLLLSLFFGVPLASLVWKLGQTGHPPQWSGGNAWRHLQGVILGSDGVKICKNLVVAGVSGAGISFAALVLCWLADESVWLRRMLIGVLALAWALPGPIIGVALKEAIVDVVMWEDRFWGHPGEEADDGGAVGPRPVGLVARVLYYGPSPAPLIWAYSIRFLPFAVAVLWPLVRMTPREPREAARLEGRGPWHEFWTIVWPLHRRGALICGVLTTALCLGEVAASARVDTPDWESYSRILFDRMHYGVDNTVAALSIALLMAVSVGGSIWSVANFCFGRRS